MKLSANQEKFCLEYHKTGNATQSYLNNYAKQSENSAAASSSALLRNPKIIARMEQLKKKAAQKYEVSLERIINENAKLAFQDLNKVLVRDSQGNIEFQEEIDFNMLDGVTISKSSGEKGDSSTVSIKLSAKVKALQELARLTGAYESKPEDNSRNREANADAILESLRKFTKSE